MRELKKVDLKNVLFLDIETTSNVPTLIPDSPMYESWEYKVNKKGDMTQEDIIESFAGQSALYPEYGRIVCVTVGMLVKDEFKVKTFSNNKSEKTILIDLFHLLDKVPKYKLCGHSIKTFDIPWLYQRAIINNLKPHDKVDVSGLKPWEIDWILDTKDLFQGTFFSRASLLGIATAIGLPSPKDVISGKDVPKFYWENTVKHTPIIVEYCEKDVITVYKILKHFKELGNEKEVKLSLVTRLFNGASYGDEEKEQLKTLLKNLTVKERAKSYLILNALCSKAKGKKTIIQKTDITQLKKELG